MNNFLLIILLILFQFCYSVISNWSLKESSQDLLLSSDSYSYHFPTRVIEVDDQRETLKMKRTINKTKDNITYSNYVDVVGLYKTVPFDSVESFYRLGNYYICPNGKQHLYYEYKQ